MEMSIDESLLYEMGYNRGFKDGIKGSILKADYETRLKADLVAMLTEIQLEIEEMVNPFGTRISGCSQDGWKHGVKNCDFVIQQKINALKGENT